MSTKSDYGVQYTPSSVIKPNPTWISIDYIRIQWVDTNNTFRYRVVSMSYYQKILKSPRPGISIAKITMGVIKLKAAKGFRFIGEYHYALDSSTLRICRYETGLASVMGWFEHKVPIPGPDGNPTLKVDLCPRTILKRIVDKAKDGGVEFLVGFENEFVLLKSKNPVKAGNTHNWNGADGLRTGTKEAVILREIASSLEIAEIEVQMYLAEAGTCQYEIITGPLHPLQSVDALIYTRETIKDVASKHGMHATFAPCVFPASVPAGAHTNISIHSKDNLKTNDRLSPYEESFLAGVLGNLTAITAVTLPAPPSYARVGDGIGTGGTYVSWGTENREALIRVANSSSSDSRRLEMRFVDGIANPYLALTAILGAGFEGIKEKRELTIKDCNTAGAAFMSEEERREHGVTERIPLTWQEARRNFGSNETMKTIFGQEYVETYLKVNQKFGEVLQGLEHEADPVAELVELF